MGTGIDWFSSLSRDENAVAISLGAGNPAPPFDTGSLPKSITDHGWLLAGSVAVATGVEAKESHAFRESRLPGLSRESLLEVRTDGDLSACLGMELDILADLSAVDLLSLLGKCELGAETADGWRKFKFRSQAHMRDALARIEGVDGVLAADPQVIAWRSRATENGVRPAAGAGDVAAIYERAGLTDAGRQAAGPRSGITIGVMDSGVLSTHPCLSAAPYAFFDAALHPQPRKPWPLWNGHGTSCAGLAVGTGGAAGIAPRCGLFDLRAWHPVSSAPDLYEWTTTDHIVSALEAARRYGGRLVLSVSLFLPRSVWIDHKFRELAATQSHIGVPIFAAAGNGGRNGLAYPASLSGPVTAIGAAGPDMEPVGPSHGLGWGTNYGRGLGLLAPGTDLPTANWRAGSGGSLVHTFDKTSAATPIVAAAAALAICANESLTAAEVMDIVKSTATPAAGMAGKEETTTHGRGNVAVDAAIARALQSGGRAWM